MTRKVKFIKNFENLIDEVNRIIEDKNIPLNQISYFTDISLPILKKILNKEIEKTYININKLRKIRSFIKNYDIDYKHYIYNNMFIPFLDKEIELSEKNILPQKKLSTPIQKKILYILNLLKEINNYEEFFISTLYLNNSRKINVFKDVIRYLNKNHLIKINNNSIYPDFKFQVFSMTKNAKTHFLKISLQYFEEKHDYYNCLILSVQLNNNELIIKYLTNYILFLFLKKDFSKILSTFKYYFIYLKINKKSKSKLLKILYISINLNILSYNFNYTKSYFFAIYLLKHIKIKNSIFSSNFNKNFDFNSIYNIDKKIDTKNFSYFIMVSLLYINNLYLTFGMYKEALTFSEFVLNKLDKKNYYYPYFYQIKYLFFINYGNLDYLKNLIKEFNLQNNKNVIKEKFRYQYKLALLEKNELNLEFLNLFFHKKALTENYNFTYKMNILEKFIFFNILTKQYHKSFNYITEFLFINSKVLFKHGLLFFIIFFISILKNNNYNILFLKIKYLFSELKDDPYFNIFNFNSKYKRINFFYNFLIKSKNVSLSSFENLSLIKFLNIIFNETIKEFENLKKEYKLSQIKLNKNKLTIISDLAKNLNLTIDIDCINNKTKNLPDYLGNEIEKNNNENQTLKLFSGISGKEDIFSYTTEIQEYNFFKNFLNILYNKIIKFFNKNSSNLSESNFNKIDSNSNIFNLFYSQNSINYLINNNFNFNDIIKQYFYEYLKKLEKQRQSIIKDIDNRSNRKNNLTIEFLSIFNNDIESEFLKFEIAYFIYTL